MQGRVLILYHQKDHLHSHLQCSLHMLASKTPFPHLKVAHQVPSLPNSSWLLVQIYWEVKKTKRNNEKQAQWTRKSTRFTVIGQQDCPFSGNWTSIFSPKKLTRSSTTTINTRISDWNWNLERTKAKMNRMKWFLLHGLVPSPAVSDIGHNILHHIAH